MFINTETRMRFSVCASGNDLTAIFINTELRRRFPVIAGGNDTPAISINTEFRLRFSVFANGIDIPAIPTGECNEFRMRFSVFAMSRDNSGILIAMDTHPIISANPGKDIGTENYPRHAIRINDRQFPTYNRAELIALRCYW